MISLIEANYSNKLVQCPYCLSNFRCLMDGEGYRVLCMGDSGVEDVECPQCEKTFILQCDHTPEFSGIEKDEE